MGRAEPVFVGLDGEGVGNRYVLLQDSRGGLAWNRRGLSTAECFSWLVARWKDARSEHPNPVFAVYGARYDFDHWLRDLPDEEHAALNSKEKEPVWLQGDFRGWRVLYIPRKLLRLWSPGGSQVTVFDVVSYFQASFVEACKAMRIPVPRVITEGKRRRVAFSLRDRAFMERYNAAEVEVLAEMMTRLYQRITRAGIEPRAWHGPGALASAVLNREKVKRQLYPYVEERTPRELWSAWDCGYFGGRIESTVVGTVGPVFAYDIASAYPHAIAQLPRLRGGCELCASGDPLSEEAHECIGAPYVAEWDRLDARNARRSLSLQLDVPAWSKRDRRLGVYLVEWHLPEGAPLGPFPWRERSTGAVSFPLNGRGWYWMPEVRAALNRWGPKRITIERAWLCDAHEPTTLACEIPRLYEERRRMKARGDDAELALKLAINSCYGKLAQREGRAPFRCLPWAGWITSTTRARIMEAISGRESDVLSIATDGILSRRRLDLAPLGKNLGDWGEETYDSATLLMSGLYLLHKGGAIEKRASRGVSTPKTTSGEASRGLNWNRLLRALNKSHTYEYQVRMFVTHAMRLHFPKKWGDAGLSFVDVDRTLDPYSSRKRVWSARRPKDYRADYVKSTAPWWGTAGRDFMGRPALSAPSSVSYEDALRALYDEDRTEEEAEDAALEVE